MPFRNWCTSSTLKDDLFTWKGHFTRRQATPGNSHHSSLSTAGSNPDRRCSKQSLFENAFGDRHAAPAPAHRLSAAPNTVKPSPPPRSLQSWVPFLCPLCLPPVFLSQKHKELLCSHSTSLLMFPHLIGASDVQEFKIHGVVELPFLCVSFIIKNFSELRVTGLAIHSPASIYVLPPGGQALLRSWE